MRKILFALALSVFYLLPTIAHAQEVVKIKIISPTQSIATGTPSGVFTVEAQDEVGNKMDVLTTTRVSLQSDSITGQFLTSSAGGPCNTATTTNVTIASGSSHKSFCYADETPGSFTISLTVLDQSNVLGDFQLITILDQTSPETPTTTPEGDATTTKDSVLKKSDLVKIYRFLPNPSGEDAGLEWVEIKNTDEAEVLLDGWLLDDEGSEPGSSAFELSGIIAPGETKRFVLPAGSFALNNSGGDEVNLYFADKTLAQKAIYQATAYDDGIFELSGSVWQPPPQTPSNGGGSGGGSSSSTTTTVSNPTNTPVINFKLNEIFPNPVGDDVGKEWIEIYNPTTATASLESYFLADGESENWSSAAWVIPKNTLVPPTGVLSIVLTKDAFSLNNSGKENVKLFGPDKKLLDKISYQDAPENSAWAKGEKDKWDWSVPTFGLLNSEIPGIVKIIISEIFPRPQEEEEEFVELYSLESSPVSLEGFTLHIGNSKKTFGVGAAILPASFFTITEEDLPTRLSNNGQTVKLLDQFSRLLSEVAYPKAAEGQAYATDDGKLFVWTSSATPEKANRYILGEETEAEDKPTSTKVKAAVAEITKAQAKQLLESNQDLKKQVSVLHESLNLLDTSLQNLRLQPSAEDPATEESAVQTSIATTKPPISRLIVWPLAIATLGGVSLYAFKKTKK